MAQALGRRRVGGGAAEQPEGDRGRCTHWRRPRLPAAGDASHRRIPAIDGVCWSCCQRCLCHCHQVDYWVLVRVHRANGELLLTDRCESTVGLPSLGPGISLTHHHHIQYASPSSPPRSHISSPPARYTAARQPARVSDSSPHTSTARQRPHQHSTPTPASAGQQRHRTRAQCRLDGGWPHTLPRTWDACAAKIHPACPYAPIAADLPRPQLTSTAATRPPRRRLPTLSHPPTRPPATASARRACLRTPPAIAANRSATAADGL